MNTTRQREHWDGDPIELDDVWMLRKGETVAQRIGHASTRLGTSLHDQ